MTKIITGNRPDVQKKDFKIGVPDESPFREAEIRKAYQIPEDASVIEERYLATSHRDLTFIWYEITL